MAKIFFSSILPLISQLRQHYLCILMPEIDCNYLFYYYKKLCEAMKPIGSPEVVWWSSALVTKHQKLGFLSLFLNSDNIIYVFWCQKLIATIYSTIIRSYVKLWSPLGLLRWSDGHQRWWQNIKNLDFCPYFSTQTTLSMYFDVRNWLQLSILLL